VVAFDLLLLFLFAPNPRKCCLNLFLKAYNQFAVGVDQCKGKGKGTTPNPSLTTGGGLKANLKSKLNRYLLEQQGGKKPPLL